MQEKKKKRVEKRLLPKGLNVAPAVAAPAPAPAPLPVPAPATAAAAAAPSILPPAASAGEWSVAQQKALEEVCV